MSDNLSTANAPDAVMVAPTSFDMEALRASVGPSVDSQLDADATRPVQLVPRDGIQAIDQGHGRMRPALPITVGDQLGLAAESNDTVKVKRLLKRGVDPNSKNYNSGVTPLGVAAERGHIESVQLLLQAKATVDVLTNDGLSPLHISSQFGQDAVIEMLCQHHANPNLRCGYRDHTPLMYAVQRNLTPTVRLLLRFKADVNVIGGEDQGTALHLASAFGHHEVLQEVASRPDAFAHSGVSATLPSAFRSAFRTLIPYTLPGA